MKQVIVAVLAGMLTLPALMPAQQSTSGTPDSQAGSQTTAKQKRHRAKTHKNKKRSAGHRQQA
jgi:hypothetical protein